MAASNAALVANSASIVFGETSASAAIAAIAVAAQPRASKRCLAAWRIASRGWAAAAARGGARYGRLLVLTISDIPARVTTYRIGSFPSVAERARQMQTVARHI